MPNLLLIITVVPKAPFANADPSTRRRMLWLSGIAYLALWVVLIVLDREISRSRGARAAAPSEKPAQPLLFHVRP